MSNRLLLEVITRSYDGRRVLYFPAIFKSDRHKGSRAYRAKRDCQLEENTISDIEYRVGDDFDGEAMVKKAQFNMGPFHRQATAHTLRKTAHGMQTLWLPGNHESGLYVNGNVVDYNPEIGGRLVDVSDTRPHRNLMGKRIFGVQITEKAHYTDPRSRVFRVEHGHLHDDHVFKTAETRNRWYRIGSRFNNLAVDIDEMVHTRWPQHSDFSVASHGKRLVKTFIMSRLGVRHAMAADIDNDAAIDGVIWGHSHMAEFYTTPGSKLSMNCGSATDHVEFLAHDRNGMWALVTWHRNRMDVLQEDGQVYTVHFKDLGLEHFSEPPRIIEDEFTWKADRLSRLMIRHWPAKDRQAMNAFIQQNGALIAAVEEMLEQGNAESEGVSDEQYQAVMAFMEQISHHRRLPVPRWPDVRAATESQKDRHKIGFAVPEMAGVG